MTWELNRTGKEAGNAHESALYLLYSYLVSVIISRADSFATRMAWEIISAVTKVPCTLLVLTTYYIETASILLLS